MAPGPLLRIGLAAALLLLGAASGGATPAAAQTGGGAAAAPSLPAAPGPAEADAAGTSPPPADLDALIATLETPAARDALIAQLRALADAQPAPAEEAHPVADAVQGLTDRVAFRANIAVEAILGLVTSVGQIPLLAEWLWQQLGDPATRTIWVDVGRQVGTAVLLGLLASLVLRFLVRRWLARMASPLPGAPLGARVKASAARFVIDLAALATFLGITYGVIAYSGVSPLAQRVAGDLLTGIGWGRLVAAVVKAVLAPDNPRRRIVDLDDHAARTMHGWSSLLLGFSLYGYFALEAARRLGLPWTVHGFLRHLMFLVVTVLAITLIYRVRGQVGAAIERWGVNSSSLFTRYLPWQLIAAVGHHVLAMWVALLYLSWAVGEPNGAYVLVRGLIGSLAILLVLRAFNVWLVRRLAPEPGAAATAGEEEEQQQQEPEAEQRTTPGSAAWLTLFRIASSVLGLALVLQVWGIDVIGWLRSRAGQDVLAVSGRIVLIAALTLIVLRAIDFGARRYIEARDEAGVPVYGNRSRTLASLLRNLALTLVIIAGVINVLGELGVNATALLAGAGVVGLAIGFGSQKLVQDLITGLFILLGDTVRVGDVVDLAGKGGVVEAISMRTIVLRDYSGNVHTVPYSSIDVVTNMTKDFSFFVFDVGVAYGEDVDRIMQILREIDGQLRREWPYRRLILEPLEIAGVDAFRDSAIIVKARTKTRPGEQWKVGREFNRRIKQRFDELGIEIPFPQRAILFAGDKGSGKGGPPPALEELRDRLLARGGEPEAAEPSPARVQARRAAGTA